MPDSTTGAPTGSTVAVGDILVVLGMQFPIIDVTNDLQIKIASAPTVAIPATTEWYIIRKSLRAPQAKNTIYVCWQPPIGLFKHGGYLGSGKYELNLSPNSEYKTACVETKNQGYVVLLSNY